MIVKKYQIYIGKVFTRKLLLVSLVFICLSFFLNILEEIKFFENRDVSIYFPIGLTLLNIPSILLELFPFIFLVATKFFFIDLLDKNEFEIFKKNGIDNSKVLFLISTLTLVYGLFIIVGFYTFSSSLKSSYLNLKNKYSTENKYLAIVNTNGLWIKEENKRFTQIINAEKFKLDELENITITNVDENYKTTQTLIAKKGNIKTNDWILKDVKIYTEDKPYNNIDKLDYNSTFNGEMISKLFSNLNSLNLFQLHTQKKNYKSLGYSTSEVDIHLNKMYSLPIYLLLMTVIGCLLMFKLKFINSKFFLVITGVFVSVLIYYLIFFSKIMGSNQVMPIELSIWFPYIILTLICLIGIIKINEK